MPQRDNFKSDPDFIKPWMYRKWQEFPSIAFVIVSFISVSVAIGVFSEFLVYWFLGIFGIIFNVYLANSYFKASALMLHRNQFPRLYTIFEEVCGKMGIVPNSIRLYIVQSPAYNAFAFGIFQKCVVFHSSLVDDFTDEELKVIMAHELAHIQAGHTIISSFLPQISNPVAELFLGFYSRNCEYSCDRAAVAVVKDVPAAVKAMLKLVAGGKISKSIDYTSFGDQIKSIKGDFGVFLAELTASHPVPTKRVREILRFAKGNLEKRV